MIRSTWRRAVRFFSSAVLATWLLAILGVWVVLGSIVPQDKASAQKVAAWAVAHPVLEPVVRSVGLHHAFTSVVFTVCALALAVCTAFCAWERTRLAVHRGRTLKKAPGSDAHSLIERHDLEIACDPALRGSEALAIASDTLGRLGIKTKREGDMLASVSPAWSVWGSPVFHWALLLLIVVLLVGNLFRSEGLMGLMIGQVKADAPASYGFISTGPLHSWGSVHRSIRVDAFEPDFQTGGVDRGPTPSVSVLDASGKVIKAQRVYPNNTLRTGSLTIYPADYGLATPLIFLNAAGAEAGRYLQFVDFSVETSDGTLPVGPLNVANNKDNVPLRLTVTVPLDRTDGQFDLRLPKAPRVRVVASSADGAPLSEALVSPGQTVELPSGDSVRVGAVGYYARLQVVDDGSIPLLYVGLVVAMVGLTIAVSARQQIVLATVIEGPDGAKLAVRVRLWRNPSSSRGEIENELTRALGAAEKESTE